LDRRPTDRRWTDGVDGLDGAAGPTVDAEGVGPVALDPPLFAVLGGDRLTG
jgi:hypothetical protein